jgi:GNAT superfamily N-acetyltransferase
MTVEDYTGETRTENMKTQSRLDHREDHQHLLHIRKASLDDLQKIALLLGHLGYPTRPSELEPVFAGILGNPEMGVFLAVTADHEVAGFISLRCFSVLRLKGFQVSIQELVVDPSFRGHGIGRALIRCAEQFARERGAVRIEVHTNRERESYRRRFYEKNGFVPSNTALYRLELGRERGRGT